MHYSEGNFGRIFVIRLHDGDRLPDTVESFAKQKNIRSAVCFFLGGVKDKGRIVVGPSNESTNPVIPLVKTLQGIHEVCGLGTLFVNEEDTPILHMHASFGRDEKVITGCIRLGIDVWNIGEVIILEIMDTIAQRKKDKKTGFELLETV